MIEVQILLFHREPFVPSPKMTAESAEVGETLKNQAEVAMKMQRAESGGNQSMLDRNDAVNQYFGWNGRSGFSDHPIWVNSVNDVRPMGALIERHCFFAIAPSNDHTPSVVMLGPTLFTLAWIPRGRTF